MSTKNYTIDNPTLQNVANLYTPEWRREDHLLLSCVSNTWTCMEQKLYDLINVVVVLSSVKTCAVLH